MLTIFLQVNRPLLLKHFWGELVALQDPYIHALKAYNDPEARKNPEKILSLVGIMAEECHNNGNYTGSVDYCAEGLAMAQKTGDHNKFHRNKQKKCRFPLYFGDFV